jgi:hypothetical protein
VAHVSFAVRELVPAASLTLAIALVVMLVSLYAYRATTRENSAGVGRSQRIARLAEHACGLRRARVLAVSTAGLLTTARCGDARSRIVTARLELVVP